MNTTELRKLSEKELEAKLLEAKEAQLKLRIQKATAPNQPPHNLRESKKFVARIHTLLTEKKGSATS